MFLEILRTRRKPDILQEFSVLCFFVSLVSLCIVGFLWRQETLSSLRIQVLAQGGLSHRRRGFDNWRNLSDEELRSLSVMGRRLFLGLKEGKPQARNFTVLLMPYDPFTEDRHFYHFRDVKVDPLQECSVRNCAFTYDVSAASRADAVYIHFHRIKGPHAFPKRGSPEQIWIWQTDESPVHNFYLAFDKDLRHYNGIFNWSMTFRMDSDIPVPYGRTIRLPESDVSQPLDKFFDQKPKLAAAMISNCDQNTNNRIFYVRILQQHMEVDFFGSCGTLTCPRHYGQDCVALEQYKFFLAFENSNCHEYITEKVWWNAFEKKAVPVVMGGTAEDYRKSLPPESFIHVDDFQTPQDLARHLRFLASDREAYLRHHLWRRHFGVVQEHGYFGAPVRHFCRLCEALNFNDRSPKTYDAIDKFWGVRENCHTPTWMERLVRADAERRRGRT